MFADAVEEVSKFTRPVVMSRLTTAGDCESGAATFIVVNNDGWILTAAHVVEQLADMMASYQTVIKYHEDVAKATAITQKRDRQRAMRKLTRPGSKSIKECSAWWGRNGVSVANFRILPDCDLALGQLTNFDTSWVKAYPTFKDPSKPRRQGTSLCRLGYPFTNIPTTYTKGKGFGTKMAGGVALFPIEGVFTRELVTQDTAGNTRELYIETSSPGLRGQSGGPIFDVDGVVWGIQCRTQHLRMGFSPKVADKAEHQFLNVGQGTHPARILELLKKHGVAHDIEK